MKLVFRRIRVYVRLVILIALALVVTLVVVKNAGHKVTVWFFKSYESINVLWLLLFTSAGSVLSWWILTATLSVWRDMREIRRMTELDKARQEQLARARELVETEKRIDRKLKEAISDGHDGDSDETRGG